jgi:hypothetical protein
LCLSFAAIVLRMYSGNGNTKNDRPVFTSSRLLDQLRERLRYLHYSLRTEKNYAYWVRFFSCLPICRRC